MEKYAVAGSGSIGSLVGGYLSRAGYDITLIPAFQREKAAFLNQNGLHVTGNGDDFRVPLRACYVGDLAAERFDVIFLGLKSNDLAAVIPELVPHLTPDGCFVTLGNGINEELICSAAGTQKVVAGVTFAGGHMEAPDHVEGHDGNFWIGELNGQITPRVRKIREILEHVRPAAYTDRIRSFQWDKLARVCLSVPSATISGLFLGDVFCEPRLQKLFALLALELFAVSKADGYPLKTVENKSEQEWTDVLAGRLSGLEGREDNWPKGVVDAYTADMCAGRSLEIAYTNGAVVRIAKKYGISVPVNEYMIDTVMQISRGEQTRGFHLVDRVLSLSGVS